MKVGDDIRVRSAVELCVERESNFRSFLVRRGMVDLKRPAAISED